MVLVALLAVMVIPAAGCAVEQVAPTQDALLTPEQAFDVAWAWLRHMYPDDAPKADVLWLVEDVEVLGPNGQPLVGAAHKRISSPDWVADVTWALVTPEFVRYEVTLKSPSFGWYWNGTVKALGGQVSEEMSMQVMNVDLATELARQFVVSSRTYVSSGVGGSVQMVDVGQADCRYCWTFVYEFNSSHSGYGDGAGQVVMQTVTPHRAVVTLEAMDVTEAIMDGQWDMRAQQFVDGSAGSAG